jgi:bifunctional lysine-specific demethylase and histidyl-hydroxylase NO66
LHPLELLTGDPQTFVDEVWASRVHVHHDHAGDLTGLLSLDDVDHLLTASGLRTPAVRVVRDGTVLPAARFTRSATLAGSTMNGVVDVAKVLDLFDSGATIVLQGLHRYWPALTDLAAGLESTLGHSCQANAYLTPPSSKGFALHSDTHDVFVVQTHGSKRWEVHDESGAQEVLMQPGTCMYLPTGTPHAAQTRQSTSLHVTVGVHQVTWRQVLDRAVQAVLDEAGQDAALPAGYPHQPAALSAGLGERLKDLADRLGSADPAALAATEVRRFWTTRRTVVPGGLRDRVEVRSLDDGTRLRRRPRSVCELVPAGERLRVLLGDRELRVPAHLAEPLELVRTSAELTPRDLSPWLDEESRRVLARRLVVEGLLEVAR